MIRPLDKENLTVAMITMNEAAAVGTVISDIRRSVPDAEAAYGFYHGELGLPYLECRPCRRGSINHAQGVVKYDVGSLMLTTHLVEGPDDSEMGRQVQDEHLLSELPFLEPVHVGHRYKLRREVHGTAGRPPTFREDDQGARRPHNHRSAIRRAPRTGHMRCMRRRYYRARG